MVIVCSLVAEYGVVELKGVCARCLLQYSATMKDGYRNCTDFRSDSVGLKFRKLQIAMSTLPVCTEVCEREV